MYQRLKQNIKNKNKIIILLKTQSKTKFIKKIKYLLKIKKYI